MNETTSQTNGQTARWQDRVVEAARGNGTRLGTILLCALGREPDAVPRFTGRASITSDGFVMCNYVARDGVAHASALVGSVDDLRANVIGLADHLRLSAIDRHSLYVVVQRWIATDYRSDPGMEFPA